MRSRGKLIMKVSSISKLKNNNIYVLVFFTLVSCNRHLPIVISNALDSDNIQNIQKNEILEKEQKPEWLTIGGQRVFNFELYSKYDYYLISEIESIESVKLFVNPKDENYAINLGGIEQLVNLRRLHIVGWNLNMLDYSLLNNNLYNLKRLTFESREEYKLTKVPDLRDMVARESVINIFFTNCALTNLNNIEFLPNLRHVEVARNNGDFTNIEALNNLQHLETLKIYSTNNSIYKIEEIASLVELNHLVLSGKLVDVKGIENLNSLRHIGFSESNVINTKYLSELKNVEYLEMMIREPEPDIEFLKGMENLKHLVLYADDDTWGNETVEKYQILDLGPIGNLSKLSYLELRGFILKNVSVLDTMNNFEYGYVFDSVFYDDSERTKKELFFHDDR
jgi:hypothetical protein